MRRIPLVVAAAAALVVLGILSSIITQGFQELARAEDEHHHYTAEKARLEHRIEDLEATLDALHSDDQAVESLARHDLGWVRPGEQVIVLATPTPLPPPPPSSRPTATPVLRWRDTGE